VFQSVFYDILSGNGAGLFLQPGAGRTGGGKFFGALGPRRWGKGSSKVVGPKKVSQSSGFVTV